jgi:hypothetical protein
LLAFWPTQFNREVEAFLRARRNRGFGAHAAYFMRLAPWVLALAALGNLVAGAAFQASTYLAPRLNFQWGNSWAGVAASTLLCVLVVGPAVGTVLSTAVGVSLSVALSVLVGLTLGVPVGMAYGEQLDVSVAVAFGVMLGLALGLAVGVAVNATEGISAGTAAGFGGILFGLIVGFVASLSGRLPVGVAAGASAGATFAAAYLLTYFRLVTYPADVALATAAYFRARWQPGAALRAWRWCPLAWNEVVWLPLPFAGSFLALLVRQDRAKGFREIAFVAAERPRQRGAARDALVDVALEDVQARSVEDLAQAADRLSWTAEAPLRLPPELTASLPGFERASRHVGQFFTLHSPYRRLEALARAREDVAGLQTALIAAGGPTGARLLQAANEWRTLLEREHETFQARAAVRQGIPNPFVVGSPVTERQANVFAGRRDVVQQVEECVLGAGQAQTILLHGPRRMGKTSILKQLPRLLGPDFAPALVDCQNPAVTARLPALLRHLSREISAAVRLRGAAAEPLSLQALESEPYAAFQEWLDALERSTPPRLRVLLCLDEYENLQRVLAAGWGEEFLDALRHVLQHRPRLVLMFTGAHTFAQQGPAWTRRFLSAQRVRVSFLTREEVIPLLTRPIPEFDMTYADGALEAVWRATNGQPFLTQVVAFQLVELLNSQQRKEATASDVEAALDRALVRNSEYFESIWLGADAEGQSVLTAVAQGSASPPRSPAYAALREQDVLTEAGTFAVPMVERWVRQKVGGRQPATAERTAGE